MDIHRTDSDAGARGERGPERLLTMLERLLEIEGANAAEALNQAAQLIADALAADKVDVFLYRAEIDSLVVEGLSDEPMSRRQVALGLDRLPLSNGGRAVDVYQTGRTYASGHVEADPEELPGISRSLGAHSLIAVPLVVAGERRGVLQAAFARAEAFSTHDVVFMAAAARWAGTLTHRAELAELATRQAVEQERRAIAEDIVTVLAHDLNNLLTPLQWHLQLLARRAAKEARERDVRDTSEAIASLKRLTRLVANLLDVARLDRGLFTLAPVPLDVAQLVRETVTLMGTRGSVVQVQAPEYLDAHADPDKLRQALENLLANALKHSPPGRPITVRVTSVVHPEGDWAVIAVSDRGKGIAPEVLPRIFERYAAGSGSPGLGLGLYLARQIAEAHGGTLSVTSTPGHGARFELAFPRYVGEEGNPPPDDETDAKGSSDGRRAEAEKNA